MYLVLLPCLLLIFVEYEAVFNFLIKHFKDIVIIILLVMLLSSFLEYSIYIVLTKILLLFKYTANLSFVIKILERNDEYLIIKLWKWLGTISIFKIMWYNSGKVYCSVPSGPLTWDNSYDQTMQLVIFNRRSRASFVHFRRNIRDFYPQWINDPNLKITVVPSNERIIHDPFRICTHIVIDNNLFLAKGIEEYSSYIPLRDFQYVSRHLNAIREQKEYGISILNYLDNNNPFHSRCIHEINKICEFADDAANLLL